MNEVERIYQLRDELHHHNHLYYVLNAPEIDDQTFDFLMRELQDLEAKHPECADENSPTMRVGSDLNKNFEVPYICYGICADLQKNQDSCTYQKNRAI